jgi:hypothetical protein
MADDKTKTQPVRLMVDVIESARIVSAYRNEPMAEMLSGILRPILKKMEREAVARRSKEEK